MLSTLLRDLGPAPASLPWSRPSHAARSLGSSERARLVSLRRGLARAWLSPQPHHELVRVLGGFDPESRVVAYPGAPLQGPRWFVHSVAGEPSESPIRNFDAMPRYRLYALSGSDPFADRPVALPPLLSRTCSAQRAVDFVELMLLDNGFLHQLRMVLYERKRVALFIGFYRSPRAPRYGESAHALLLALRPSLREWARVASVLGVVPLGDGALASVLSAFDQPALLVRRGRVIFANASGRSFAGATAEWARMAPRPEGFATVMPLRPSGLDVDLVLPLRGHRARPSFEEVLPPALAPVAAMLGEGLADKEIAERLGMPLATVRTYVARVFQRLRVHDRRELIRRSS